MGFPAYYAMYGDEGADPQRRQPRLHSPLRPLRVRRRRGGFLGIQNEREWERFCEVVLERPELTETRGSPATRTGSPTERPSTRRSDGFRAPHAEGNRKARRGRYRQRQDDASGAGVPGPPAATGPRPLARGRFPAGPLPALLPPGLPTDAEPVMAPIPEVGEHTAAILTELGYDEGSWGMIGGHVRPRAFRSGAPG